MTDPDDDTTLLRPTLDGIPEDDSAEPDDVECGDDQIEDTQ